jgi:predicted DCC family thiol-disulfide oxidoreductase YuxK
MRTSSHPIVLYDGVCGLCNRLVQCVLRHDRAEVFRFASLQGTLAAEILRGRHLPPDLNSVYVVLNYREPGEQLLARSDAILFILRKLRTYWGVLGSLGALLPRSLRDAAYNVIAHNRYRIWGKYETCPLPDPKHRHRFLHA